MHSGAKGWERSRIAVCLLFSLRPNFLRRWHLSFEVHSDLPTSFQDSCHPLLQNLGIRADLLKNFNWAHESFCKVDEFQWVRKGFEVISWGSCFLSFCAVVGQLPPSFPAHILRWQQGFNSWPTEKETKDCERLTTEEKNLTQKIAIDEAAKQSGSFECN